MPFTFAALCTALSLSACSTPDAPHMLTPYFEDDFRFWTGSGPSSLEGTINLKLDDGQVVTCAGAIVSLMPATAYNMEYEQYLEQGMVASDYSRHARQFTRTVNCDSNGHYLASSLPEVRWIVLAHVTSEDGKSGWIFQEKTLKGGANTLDLTKDDLVFAK